MCHIVEGRASEEGAIANEQAHRRRRPLYERHGSALVAYACSCGLDFASAEDTVQQVFLKMLCVEPSKPEVPLAYLYRATRNACVNLHRDRMRETELPKGEYWFVHSSGNQEQVITLERALRDLPEEQRQTVFLRFQGENGTLRVLAEE